MKGKVKRSGSTGILTRTRGIKPSKTKKVNDIIVSRQKKKAKKIANAAADKLDSYGDRNTVTIEARIRGLGESQEDYAKKRLRKAKRGRKQKMDAGRIRKAAAKIK